MRYYLNTETDVVQPVDDSEDPARALFEPEKWVPVHIHRDQEIPAGYERVGGGQYRRNPSLGSKVAVRIIASALIVAVVAGALALAVLAVRFLAGAFA